MPWNLRSLWYELMHVAGMTGFNLGFSFRYEGSKNVPSTGPVLVVANHQSFVDPWIVGLAVRRHLVYLARKTLFRNPLFASFLRSLNAVPIDQEGVGKEGIRAVLEQLGQGKAVLIFPEGSRTPDGSMHPFKPGIHLLLKRMRVPILPVGIAGAYDAWPIWRKYPIPAPIFWAPGKGTIAVAVGKPIDSEVFLKQDRAEALAALFLETQNMQERAESLRRK